MAQRYFIYRTDGKTYMGVQVGPQWRNQIANAHIPYVTYEDASEARRVSAKLRAQGHDCDVEVQEE